MRIVQSVIRLGAHISISRRLARNPTCRFRGCGILTAHGPNSRTTRFVPTSIRQPIAELPLPLPPAVFCPSDFPLRSGAGCRILTRDPLRPNQLPYQLTYAAPVHGGGSARPGPGTNTG